MSVKWYYKVMGEDIGPLSTVELRRHALDGKVTPETNIRRSDNDRWEAAWTFKGLFDATQVPAVVPPSNVAESVASGRRSERIEESPQFTLAPPHPLGGGLGLNITLFLIGSLLLVVAFALNNNLNNSETHERRFNTATGNFIGEVSGRYEYKATKTQDRFGVYVAAGIGAVFILGGLMTLGRNEKKP